MHRDQATWRYRRHATPSQPLPFLLHIRHPSYLSLSGGCCTARRYSSQVWPRRPPAFALSSHRQFKQHALKRAQLIDRSFSNWAPGTLPALCYTTPQHPLADDRFRRRGRYRLLIGWRRPRARPNFSFPFRASCDTPKRSSLTPHHDPYPTRGQGGGTRASGEAAVFWPIAHIGNALVVIAPPRSRTLPPSTSSTQAVKKV